MKNPRKCCKKVQLSGWNSTEHNKDAGKDKKFWGVTLNRLILIPLLSVFGGDYVGSILLSSSDGIRL